MEAANEWRPQYNPWLIAIAVMSATIIEVLDSSIANVALPSIAGNLSADNNEATWILTSYIVSNAIVLPATAWFSSFLGRKRFLIICISIFTAASVLCAMAGSLGFLIFFRVLQGAGGGALMPISQAILLESFPKEKRSQAMAVFAMGVIVAPIVGPILGGWLIVNYSWRLIFLINLPIGLLATVLVKKFVEDPPYLKRVTTSIDYIGFLFMALGLGLMQVILDKGQEADWLNAPWICWMILTCALSLLFFIAWELRVKNPVVDLRIFKDRNFTTGSIISVVLGLVLYSASTLLPLFFQSMIGYTAYYGGLAAAPRGVGSFLTAVFVGTLGTKIDSRILCILGLFALGLSSFGIAHLNLDTSLESSFGAIFLNGVGISLAFVPLMTLSMGTLNNNEMGNATGVFNLMRNIGGGMGIALTTTMLARMGQVHQVFFASHLTPYDYNYQEAVKTQGTGRVYQDLMTQASLLSYMDCLYFLGTLAFLSLPLVFFFRRVQSKADISVH